MKGAKVESLLFGYETRREVALALEPCPIVRQGPLAVTQLVKRLTSYAEGRSVVLSDVELAESAGRTSAFARRVIAACRKIPAGQTRTYGQLAAAAGSPGAARAVGRCMATNPVPILVPCHRVVGSDGKLHGFSAPGGLAMKRRLLELEREAVETGSR